MRLSKPFLLAALLLLVACADDDDHYADSYTYALADAVVSAAGNVAQLNFDNGTASAVSNHFPTTFSDTVVRSRVLFVAEDSGVRLVKLANVLAFDPIVLADDKVKTDPLAVHAVWRGGHYVNFYVSLPTGASAKSHYVGVVDDGIQTSASGAKVLHLRLYHDQNTDAESYGRPTYFSCRVGQYADRLSQGDSICVSIATESAGVATYMLPF